MVEEVEVFTAINMEKCHEYFDAVFFPGLEMVTG